MAATAPQMSPQEQNFYGRQRLLSTGIAMIKRLQPVTGTLGQNLRIPLNRMGVMTGVLLQFTVPITITAPCVASPVAPWNIAQSVSYTDFTGVQRTRTNGYQLWAGQCFKNNDAISLIPAMSGGAGVAPSMNYNTNIVNQPTANGAANIYFSLWVPMAVNPASDLTGAVMTQTNVGEHFINVQLANALVNADPWIAPYISGTATSGTVTVEAFQHYIQPQSMALQDLPLIDLSMNYGFEGGFQSAANIAAGMSTYINFPNNRSILGTLLTYENASAFTLNETDISQITLQANSNTNFRETSPRYLREVQRNMINSDLPSSSYYFPSRAQPFMTQLYANVQAKVDVAAVTGGGVTQFITQFEVIYPSGSPLPGISIANQ